MSPLFHISIPLDSFPPGFIFAPVSFCCPPYYFAPWKLCNDLHYLPISHIIITPVFILPNIILPPYHCPPAEEYCLMIYTINPCPVSFCPYDWTLGVGPCCFNRMLGQILRCYFVFIPIKHPLQQKLMTGLHPVTVAPLIFFISSLSNLLYQIEGSPLFKRFCNIQMLLESTKRSVCETRML